MQRTGPRTGAQKYRSRLNKFKAFIQIFSWHIWILMTEIQKALN